jgi:predicted nucleic-acid-binding Zn-ribbon protein
MAENIRGDIVSEKGRGVTFEKKTERPCPVCNANDMHEDRVLHIRSHIENSVTLECPNCAYTTHLPISDVPEAQGNITDIKGRPVG